MKKCRYQVFDCGVPADYRHHNVDPSWKNSSFKTLHEAAQYAHNWLGRFSPWLYFHEVDGKFLLKPYDYSGCGDTIQIKKVK